jgi:hypothetical protein
LKRPMDIVRAINYNACRRLQARTERFGKSAAGAAGSRV